MRRRQAQGRRRVLAGGTGGDLTTPLWLSPFKLWAASPELALPTTLLPTVPGLVPQGQSRNAALLASTSAPRPREGRVIRKSGGAPRGAPRGALLSSFALPVDSSPRRGQETGCRPVWRAERLEEQEPGEATPPSPTFCTCLPPRHDLGLDTFLELAAGLPSVPSMVWGMLWC